MKDDMDIKIKKDIYVSLAFSLYGHLIGLDKSLKEIKAKSMGFVVNPEGEFFLIAPKDLSFNTIDLTRNVLFTIIKEGRSVVDMSEIQVEGKANLVQEEDLKEKIRSLFLEKSPYFSSIPFMDDPSNFVFVHLIPSRIKFQNLQEEREGKDPYFLEKI